MPSSQLHLMNWVGEHKLPVLCMLDFLDNSNMKGNLWNSTSDIHKFANNIILFWCLNIVTVSCSVNIVIWNASNTPILIGLVLMASLKNHNQQQLTSVFLLPTWYKPTWVYFANVPPNVWKRWKNCMNIVKV